MFKSKTFEVIVRYLVILAVGAIVYFMAVRHNEKIAEKQLHDQPVASAPVVAEAKPIPLPSLINEAEAKTGAVPIPTTSSRADDAIRAAMEATETVEVSPNPIYENQTPPTYYSDMDGNERDVIDSVYDKIWLDAERRTGVNYKNIKIEDIYRIDDSQFHPRGMNSYESYVFIGKRCEIVSFSINFQNRDQFRITGNRKC